MCSFHTIEDFWRYFNHIPKPSEVFYDGDTKKRIGPDNKIVEEYSLFKKGIAPEWEDSANQSGGEWYCRQHLEGDVLNMYWQNLAISVIGETIDDGIDDGSGVDYINGVRVVDKGKAYPMFRLELWINTKDSNVKERIKSKLVEIITHGLPPTKRGAPKFEWKDHS